MEITPTVSSREVGAIPISIGTSLAIESAFGILPDQETDKPLINDYDAVWINVRTLYRNLIGAIDSTLRGTLFYKDLVDALSNEMQTIEASFSHITKGRVSVTFYICSYASVSRRFPYAMHKHPNTPLQKENFTMEQLVVKTLTESLPSHDYREFDVDLDGVPKNTLMITHYPIDLLNRYKFKSLSLLETHTGAVKSPGRWYTKLHGGRELVNIPFDRMTLQMFGDNILFSPMAIKIRRGILEIADKNKWLSVSTKDLVVRSIKDEHDPVLEAFILKLY
jgi:hypothetical protein